MKKCIVVLFVLFVFIQASAQEVVHIPALSDSFQSMQMVRIEPGTFIMGDNGRLSQEKFSAWPEHEVEITYPFEISKIEITQAQYEAIRGSKSNHSNPIDPELSVNKINWYDCQLFLHKLNKLDLGHFRLPTEAEWEYACTLADSLGLQNMDSGVGEWCSDRWQTVSNRGPQVDPHYCGGFINFINPLQNRVFKGSPEENGKVIPAHRHYEQAIDYHYVIGFRVVRDVESAPGNSQEK